MNCFGVLCVVFYCFLKVSQCQEDGLTASDGGNTTKADVSRPEDLTDEHRKAHKDRDVESSRISQATPAPGETRKSRTLFSKLHSKASFLAGLKLGSLLSKKGFELGHGKIASSHTFQLFGKTVNSATSLSYGNGNSLLPILDDSPAPEGGTKAGSFDKDVFHVTVIENPWEETVHKVDEIASDPVIEDGVFEGNQTGKTKSQIVKVYQEVKDGDDLLSEHNNLVRDLNRSIHKRTNSKFKATTF